MNLLPLVLRNLSRNRRRTLLTVRSIAVSVFMFAALMSLPTLVDEILKDRANSVRITTYAKTGLSYPLPAAYAAKIAQLPHVEAVTGESVFPSTYRDPKDFVPAAAMDPTQLESLFPDSMRSLSRADFVARLPTLDADWSHRAAAAPRRRKRDQRTGQRAADQQGCKRTA